MTLPGVRRALQRLLSPPCRFTCSACDFYALSGHTERSSMRMLPCFLPIPPLGARSPSRQAQPRESVPSGAVALELGAITPEEDPAWIEIPEWPSSLSPLAVSLPERTTRGADEIRPLSSHHAKMTRERPRRAMSPTSREWTRPLRRANRPHSPPGDAGDPHRWTGRHSQRPVASGQASRTFYPKSGGTSGRCCRVPSA